VSLAIRFIVVSAIATLAMFGAAPTHAEALRGEIEAIIKDYLATHPDEVGIIAKDYMRRHPEALQEIIAELLKRRAPNAVTSNSGPPSVGAGPANPDKSALVKSNAAALFTSAHQVTLGNPGGDITMVEFFDYNCGYCKRALGDMLDLLKSDAKLRIVLKEFPILGPGSLEAARVSIAVRMQDPAGLKFLEFHRRLLVDRGPASKARATEIAQEIGLDMPQLEKDMASEEIDKTLEESTSLARALGLNGTPSYVVGEDVVIGAVGHLALKSKVDALRR
jgi:protein-disulfide isomerase